ncbi:MAG: hypothetical protein Q9175_000442 [Cornicularia normoerica]
MNDLRFDMRANATASGKGIAYINDSSVPFYQRSPGLALTNNQEGPDGIELSLHGDLMCYSPLTSDHLFGIETPYLRANSMDDVLSSLGQRGGNANGFSANSNGAVYVLMPEQNAIYIYNSTTLQAEPYIRNLRIIWPDWNNGTDLR